jgi:hypothetical protein
MIQYFLIVYSTILTCIVGAVGISLVYISRVIRRSNLAEYMVAIMVGLSEAGRRQENNNTLLAELFRDRTSQRVPTVGPTSEGNNVGDASEAIEANDPTDTSDVQSPYPVSELPTES